MKIKLTLFIAVLTVALFGVGCVGVSKTEASIIGAYEGTIDEGLFGITITRTRKIICKSDKVLEWYFRGDSLKGWKR